ncbi:Endonuclease V [compost metagenome]
MDNTSLYDRMSPSEAVELQKQLRSQIDLSPYEGDIKYIGGADISFNRFETTVYAGIVVLSYPEMQVVSRVAVVEEATFPYISGLLAFREVPALLKAWQQLDLKPDVLVLDGQGIAHPRRLGIATHFGLVAGVPTLGCGKSRLTGTFEEPANEPLSQSSLWHQGEQIGVVLRTKRNCKPVFVSPGHHISMEQSVQLISKSLRGYRIPEPTRKAHLWVNEVRLQAKEAPGQQLFV